jgi:hypothetical protein
MKPITRNSDRVKRCFYLDVERATTLALFTALGVMLWLMLG